MQPPQQPALIDITSVYEVQPKRAAGVSFHSGPLPDPVTMAEYGQVDPSFPERIVTLTERTVYGNLAINERQSRKEGLLLTISGVVTMVAVLGALVLAGVALWLDRPWAATLFGLCAIGTVLIPKTIEATRSPRD